MKWNCARRKWRFAKQQSQVLTSDGGGGVVGGCLPNNGDWLHFGGGQERKRLPPQRGHLLVQDNFNFRRQQSLPSQKNELWAERRGWWFLGSGQFQFLWHLAQKVQNGASPGWERDREPLFEEEDRKQRRVWATNVFKQRLVVERWGRGGEKWDRLREKFLAGERHLLLSGRPARPLWEQETTRFKVNRPAKSILVKEDSREPV